MLGRIGSLIARVAEEAGSVVGLRFGTEEPRYTSEKVIGLEIRNYGPRIAAETTVFGDEDKALSERVPAPRRLHLRRQPRQRQDRDDSPGRTAVGPEGRHDGAGVEDLGR